MPVNIETMFRELLIWNLPKPVQVFSKAVFTKTITGMLKVRVRMGMVHASDTAKILYRLLVQ